LYKFYVEKPRKEIQEKNSKEKKKEKMGRERK
jgi:hypothetical protein